MPRGAATPPTGAARLPRARAAGSIERDVDALDALADVFVFRFGRDGDDTFGAVGGGVLGGALFRGHVFAGAEPRHRPASGAGVEHVRDPRARVDVAEVGMLRGFGRRVDGDVLVSVRVLPSRRRVRLLRVREDARGLGLDRLVRRVALEAIAGRVRDVGEGSSSPYRPASTDGTSTSEKIVGTGLLRAGGT